MHKHRLLLFIGITLVFTLGCKEKKEYFKLEGTTMGTYFAITYEGHHPQKMLDDVNSLLIEYNDVLSAYIPSSTIRRLNDGSQNLKLTTKEKSYFAPVILATKRLKSMTDGALNPSISPVVNYWGFGYTGKKKDDSVDSTLISELVLLSKSCEFKVEGDSLIKFPTNAQVDYSSLAKGYGIDVLAAFFDERNIQNYLIDVGGEARTKGVNAQGQKWRLAINTPRENTETDEMEMVIEMDNMSIATSGNYRQYYVQEGKKYAHIIDPNTGYPALSNLLSTSILMDECMDADGLATALCVMGLERAKSFLDKHQNVKACLIYDKNGDDQLEKYFANGFENYVVESK